MALRPPLAVSSLMLALCACTGDPNENPLVDVEPTCGAESHDERYFGDAFTRTNESAREQLQLAYSILSDNSEPSLACGRDVDEAYRITFVADRRPAPLIVRVERAGDRVVIRGIGPRVEDYRVVLGERVDRVLTPGEWKRAIAAAQAVDVLATRALPAGPYTSRETSGMFLYEFRRRGAYALVMRPPSSIPALTALDALRAELLSLADYEYPAYARAPPSRIP